MKILTIVIPVYNQEDLILKALNSIPKRDDIQVIIVNDYSTDNTINKINEWAVDKKYNLITLLENKGTCFAKNRG